MYALRTKDGGALIQYSLTKSTSIMTGTKSCESEFIPVPAGVRWAINKDKVRFKLTVSEVHQYATSVPAAQAPTRAEVIAHDGGATRVVGE